MKQDYKKTTYACFIGYIVQAIVNSFVPLLFVTFQKTYQIPLTKITLLITINFVIQLLIDLLSAGFIDKIGYRASVIIAHICAAAGLVLLTVLPELFADPFVGILMSVVIYAVGGGLLEVLVSPIIEACPTDNKEAAMSLLLLGMYRRCFIFHSVFRTVWNGTLENPHTVVGDHSDLQYDFIHKSANLQSA